MEGSVNIVSTVYSYNRVVYNIQDYPVSCLFFYFSLGSSILYCCANTHTIQGVCADIKNYAPKVRVGGIVGFDDYGDNFPCTIKAIDEFVAANSGKVTLLPFGDPYNIDKYIIVPQEPLTFPW